MPGMLTLTKTIFDIFRWEAKKANQSYVRDFFRWDAKETSYCCTLLYTPVLVRKRRSLKLLLYSTLHPSIVEGEQVQHVTAVLYFTPQYWWGRAGPSSFCCTLLYTHLNPKVLALIFPIHEICKYASDQLKQIQVLIKQKYSTHIPDQ